MRERSAMHRIGVYDFDFEFVVTTDMVESQKTRRKKLNLAKSDEKDYTGLTWGVGRRIMVLVQRNKLTHNTVAHEVFHAAFCILHYCDHKVKNEEQEPCAYLIGHITEIVYKDLKKWKIKIK